ncbi:MAG: hypothetical protein WCY09_08830 [Candidatus Omnitrophota bacterium]|jgi:hypothetical protein
MAITELIPEELAADRHNIVGHLLYEYEQERERARQAVYKLAVHIDDLEDIISLQLRVIQDLTKEVPDA